MKRSVPGLFAVLVVLAACAASGGTPGSPPGSSADDSPGPSGSAAPPGASGGNGGEIEHPAGSEPVLVVEESGGMVMVQTLGTRLPTFVMLGDGQVIIQGMQTLEFPGPALPALIERTLSEDGVQAVLSAVEETNLFTGDLELRGAQNVIADATDTVFTLNAGGRTVTVSVYGLGLLGPALGNPQGVTSGEIQAHGILSQLRDALLTVDTAVPADSWEAEGWQPYAAEAVRLYVRDVTGEPVEGGDLPEQVRDWPTDDDPAAFGEEEVGFGDGTRCGVVTGDAAAAWLEALAAANQMTLWTTGGDTRFAVQARPILPHEEPTCPELFPG